MRNLTVITVLLAILVCAGLGWGAYWFVGARATERGLAAWLEARRAEGWIAAAAQLETHGFPNRFDTTFTALDLDDPETGVGWTAPIFQILSLSYRPTEVIAVWPGAQELRLPGETLAVGSDRMIGSLALGPSAVLPLRRLVIEGGAVEIASTRDWTAGVGAAQVALRESPGAEGAPVYDIALSLDGFAPDSAELARLRDLVGLPEAIETVQAELTVTFDKGWDITALEDRRPQPREIAVTRLDARWGDLALAGTGQIAVDEAGVGTGELVLEATNWRDIVALAEASGALPANRAPLVRAALETLASVSGDPDRLDVTLRFSGGFLLLGPVPIGAAPRFLLP
ncbi:MAG: DUF2125 domain-containing protein [Maritimibacter sp.]|nr:DUF2125 domain-containing protein [Maritimibacter sp.]